MNKKSSNTSIVRILVITLVLLFIGTISLGFAMSPMGFTSFGEPAPEFASAQNGQVTNNCTIPSDYFEVFKSSVYEYPDASVALVAAIFYAGEHGKSWPDINGPWETSDQQASGPFQFLEGTWKKYGTGPYSNAQNINLASKAAANFINQNWKTQSGIQSVKIKKIIHLYNHSDSYVNAVYDQYIAFSKCLSGGSESGKYQSLDQVKTYFGSTQAEIKTHLQTTSFLGKNIVVNKVMVDDLKKVEAELKKSNYKITTVGAYNFRANVNDPTTMSAHAFGLAIDINPTANPNAERPMNSKERDPSICKHDIPDQVAKAFEDNNFFWGAKFKTICDPMHFQYGGNWN